MLDDAPGDEQIGCLERDNDLSVTRGSVDAAALDETLTCGAIRTERRRRGSEASHAACPLVARI